MSPNHLLVWSSILVVAFLIAAAGSVRTWLIRPRRTRETFALWVVLCVATALADLFVSFRTFMPWQLPIAWWKLLFSEDWVPLSPHPAEYILAIVGVSLGYRSARHAYDRWDGEQSIEHHRHAERGEAGSLISDGLSELLRVVRRKPTVGVYQAATQQRSESFLETVHDSAAWKDEARELVRLGTSSYLFDANADWHDAQSCWLGTNTRTGEPVFLFPWHVPPASEDVRKFVAYSQKMAKDRSAADVEIIVAVEEAAPDEVTVLDKFIRVVTREELLDRLVDFTDYRNGIIRRVQSQPLPDSNLRLLDVYVRSRFVRGDEVAIGDAESYLSEWLSEPGQRQVAMLGGYGQGKSTTALMFTYNLLTSPDWSKQRIPVFVELRGTSPRNLTPLQLFGAWAAQYNINAQALMKLHIAGKLLLIFEGFDEMSLVGDAEMRLKHFRVLWQFCYERAKILITGRPNFFLDDSEMRLALGIHVPTVGRPYCDAVRLAPFNHDQIRDSLRAHPSAVRNGIPPLVESNPRFADLVSRPSLLHIVAVLWEKEKLYDQLDKLNSAYVMELFVRHSYTRQGLKESQSPDFMALTTREREYFMQGIAAYMVANGLPNQIHISSLNRLIEDLIQGAPQAISTEADALSGEVARPLRERLAESEYGVEHVKTDVRACGLLVDDPAASGAFRFGHKSFMEYIFAAVVADRVVSDSTFSRTILRIANARIGDILRLPVAVEFLSELVEGKRVYSTGLSHEKPERVFARQLLSATLDHSGFMALGDRFSLFNGTYERALDDLPTLPRLFARSLPLSLPLLVLSGSAAITLRMIRSKVLHNSIGNSNFAEIVGASNSARLAFTALFLLSVLTPIIMRSLLLGARPHQRASYALWNLICKRLQINDLILHRIAGTYWLPWARHKPFDYFYRTDPDFAREARPQAPRTSRTA